MTLIQQSGGGDDLQQESPEAGDVFEKFTFNQSRRGAGVSVRLSSQSACFVFTSRPRETEELESDMKWMFVKGLNSDRQKKDLNTFASHSVNLLQVISERRCDAFSHVLKKNLRADAFLSPPSYSLITPPAKNT